MAFISPFRLAPGRLRASSGQRQRTLEVDGGAQQLQMAGVAAEPDVADATEAVTAFHDPEAALDGGTDRGDRLVEPALPRLQRLVAGRPVHQAVVDAGLGQSGAQGLRSVGLVAVDGALGALDQRRRRLAVVQVGGGEDRGADDLRALVNRHVRLVAEVTLAVLLRPAGLRVALADRAVFHRRRLDRGLQQRRVDQRALADNQPAGIELAVDLLEQRLGQSVRRQLLAEAPESSNPTADRRSGEMTADRPPPPPDRGRTTRATAADAVASH